MYIYIYIYYIVSTGCPNKNHRRNIHVLHFHPGLTQQREWQSKPDKLSASVFPSWLETCEKWQRMISQWLGHERWSPLYKPTPPQKNRCHALRILVSSYLLDICWVVFLCFPTKVEPLLPMGSYNERYLLILCERWRYWTIVGHVRSQGPRDLCGNWSLEANIFEEKQWVKQG